jgi:ABC-type uncharacterized transport system involved in gliding motility auxiliary subunit
MSTASNKRNIGYSSLALVFVALVAAVMASNTLLKGMRFDLTENNLYTLSPGTRSMLAGIEEPINLYLYYSDQQTEDLPALRTYANRVIELLEEFTAAADGGVNLQVIDPLPFSEEEDRASQQGLQPVTLSAGGDTIYFGLAGTNSVGDTDVIPFFEPSERKEAFLEYDIARLVYNLANPDKAVIGILSSAPITGGFDPQTQQPSEPWVVTSQIRQLFEVRTLPTSLLTIDEDVDVLWVVHPEDLDESTLYAIDQFILRGGRALVFVDPYAEVLSTAGPTGLSGVSSSTLEPLFDAWGLRYSPSEVVADNRYALSIRTGAGGMSTVRHIGLLGIQAEGLDQQDVVTAGLSTLNFGIAGRLSLDDDATVTLTPLATSSTEAAILPANRFQFLPDPRELLGEFAPAGEEYVLAARLEGRVASAFPGGPPNADEDAAADADSDGETAAGADDDAAEDTDAAAAAEDGERSAAIDDELASRHVESTDNANIIVVADVDILSDRLWVQVQNFLGQRLLTSFANNGDLVVNALDNLSGSAELIGLRSRASYSRPFTTVEDLQREAALRLRATEERLQAELDQTEQRLGELQTAREDQGSLLMSEEQQAEIQRFLDERVQIREQLRAVRRNLDRDIERLGATLKVLNIVVAPVALTLLVLLLTVLKRRARSRRP